MLLSYFEPIWHRIVVRPEAACLVVEYESRAYFASMAPPSSTADCFSFYAALDPGGIWKTHAVHDLLLMSSSECPSVFLVAHLILLIDMPDYYLKLAISMSRMLQAVTHSARGPNRECRT